MLPGQADAKCPRPTLTGAAIDLRIRCPLVFGSSPACLGFGRGTHRTRCCKGATVPSLVQKRRIQ